MNEELAQYQQQLDQMKAEETAGLHQMGQSSIFGNNNEQNLIQYQLDLREELERIDHLLRGHQLKYDDTGNLKWVEPTDDSMKPFNDKGVQIVMNVISFYLNRNTILSNYSEPMINWKMKDLGDELADLIFMKYEEMGMNTSEKKKQYPIIVREIVDSVHSAYLRAMAGGERESLRTARSVVQNDSMNKQENYPSPKKQFSMFKPTTWGR
jgi:hypothetical protein|tara:strand:+ start:174 stop:803 length:630 start_codon:yes stop_codon:yes gene_type:complete